MKLGRHFLQTKRHFFVVIADFGEAVRVPQVSGSYGSTCKDGGHPSLVWNVGMRFLEIKKCYTKISHDALDFKRTKKTRKDSFAL